MNSTSPSRSGTPWTERETNFLIRARNRGESYGKIASSKTFKDRRSIKALRRRYERVELDLG